MPDHEETPQDEEDSAVESESPSPGDHGERRSSLPTWLPAVLMGIGLIALFHTLVVARDYLLPIVIALILHFMLSPLVRALKVRARLPTAVGAALVLATLAGTIGYGVYLLAEPATDWAARVPQSVRTLKEKVRQLRQPVETVNEAAEEVENLARMGRNDNVQKIEVQQPRLTNVLLSGTRTFLGGAVVTTLLLFFFLASGDRFLIKLTTFLSFSHQPVSAEVLRQGERQVSAYLVTITLINCALGLTVGATLYFAGLPNPILWGVLATSLNFIPYLGSLVGVTVVGLASILTFDSLGQALVPPLVYAAATCLEGMVVTPAVLGRRLSLSPVVILLWLLLWTWMWDIAGAFLAVPMLAVVKIFCDRIESLRPVSDLLGP